MPPDHLPVATAPNSAAWRAIETEEDTPLCVDPFAAQLAGTHALKVARSMAQVRE